MCQTKRIKQEDTFIKSKFSSNKLCVFLFLSLCNTYTHWLLVHIFTQLIHTGILTIMHMIIQLYLKQKGLIPRLKGNHHHMNQA